MKRANEQNLTRYKTLCNLVICIGGSCKRSVDQEALLGTWKRDYLWQASHLSFSDCLGPCDLASNACLTTDKGMVWLSGLEGNDFATLTAWAKDCKEQKCLLELPDGVVQKQITRYEDANVMTFERKKV